MLKAPKIIEFIKKRGLKVSSSEPTSGEEVWIKKSSQLLDVSQGFQNAYINSGGGVVSATNNALFDFIKIKGNTTYTASANIVLQGLNFAFFDEGKHFISREISNSVRSATKLSPTNAKYARIWINYDDVTDITQEIINSLDIMLNEGEILPYEPYIEKEIYCKNENGVYERFYSESEEKYYYPGDEIEIESIPVAGFVTSSAKDLYLGFSTKKDISKINNILIPTSFTGSIRVNSTLISVSGNLADYISSISKRGTHGFVIVFHNDNGWGVPNNSICVGYPSTNQVLRTN